MHDSTVTSVLQTKPLKLMVELGSRALPVTLSFCQSSCFICLEQEAGDRVRCEWVCKSYFYSSEVIVSEAYCLSLLTWVYSWKLLTSVQSNLGLEMFSVSET